MKKTMRLLVIFLFPALIFLSGCKKDPGIEPVDPTLTALAVPEVVDFNGDSKVTYSSSGLDSLTMNGIKVSVFGAFDVTNLQKDTSFVFIGYSTTSGGTKAGIKSLYQTVKITVRPEIVFDPVTIEITYDTLVPYRGDAYVSWEITGNVKKFTVNGQYVPSGGLIIYKLKNDTILNFLIIDGFYPDDTLRESILIKVAPKTQADINMDILILHSWSIKTAIVSCDGETWYTSGISQAELDTKYFFAEDGTWEAYRYGELVNWDDFSIYDSTFIWGGGFYNIKTLTVDTLKLEHPDHLIIGCPNNIGISISTYTE